jgi:glutamyl-tRNA synthetase
MIRTRFAPSPTGYLHIGGARTALFSWAFARHHGGQFILRIEDTDLERSTEASTQAILEGLQWLGIDYDEGPFYQMKRLSRYQEVVDQLLTAGHAYYCYTSKEEIEVMRAAQRERGEKPRYDGRWRDSQDTPPVGVKPVIRFKTPLTGEVTFNDLVKGPITVANSELDDLVIMRADGVPTYNFGVVVDDLDMGITHVIRGDDHVNNTPRQINIMQALGASIPHFAHVPMILGSDGERLSKRHGAVSVTQYRDEGYLPQALMNYLSRLGWSHGDEEMFSQEQFIEWFDLAHISRSPARFNTEKLDWLNQQYLKQADDTDIALLLKKVLDERGVSIEGGPDMIQVIALLKSRVTLIPELADAALYFYQRIHVSEELRQLHLTEQNLASVKRFKELIQFVDWTVSDINECLQQTIKELAIKMPQIAIPLRVIVCGQTQTPSIDQTLYLIGREEVLARMALCEL